MSDTRDPAPVEIPDFAPARVLVVGDAMLDRYWFGAVDRISPEAPVPVMAVDATEDRAGGAANVAVNVAALGARCTLIAAVGDDDSGRSLATLLAERGVDQRLIADATMPTTLKLRMLAQNQQLMRADFERKASESTLDTMTSKAIEELAHVDVLILSDYGKGGLGHSLDFIEAAKARSVPVIVDPKGDDFSRYRGATMITPNLKEFEAVAGRSDSEADMLERAQRLLDELDLESLMVTRSAAGISLFTRDGKVHASPSRAREVFDVSGAGDTVIATVAAMHALGITGERALSLANVAAGVVVSRIGTAAVTIEDIQNALSREAGS